MPASTKPIIIQDTELKRVSVLTNLSLQCPAGGPADGAGSAGCATDTAGPVLWEEEEEAAVTEEQSVPLPPPLMDAYAPCINATCRIPSVLHSLTVCLRNNRWSLWNWSTCGQTQITPPPPHSCRQAHILLISNLEFRRNKKQVFQSPHIQIGPQVVFLM